MLYTMAVFVLCLGWLVLSAGVLFGFLLMHFQLLPIPVKHLYLFGKLRKRTEGTSFVKFFDVPKRWFLHFYIIGLVCNSSTLVIMMDVWHVHLPNSAEHIFQVFHILKGNYQAEPSPVLPILLVLVLEELQVVRRLYESMTVSIYSDNKMSIIHYLTGIILYSTFGISLLAELVSREKMPVEVNWGLSLLQYSGILLFVWAWCNQYAVTRQLAGLRRKATGGVADTSHHIPSGGLFDLVSCPHYLMEILIYTSFCLITRFQSPSINSITCFVIVNQMISAVLTHSWYREKFYKYPRHRRALLPYLL